MYIIPEAFKLNSNNYHNRGCYSLWAHFVEYCIYNAVFYSSKRYKDVSTEPFFQLSHYRKNPHIPGANRLDVFIKLSMSRSVSDGTKDIPVLTQEHKLAGEISCNTPQSISMNPSKSIERQLMDSTLALILDDGKEYDVGSNITTPPTIVNGIWSPLLVMSGNNNTTTPKLGVTASTSTIYHRHVLPTSTMKVVSDTQRK